MLQPYDRIRRFTYLIAATLILSFAGASFVLVWQDAKIVENKDKNAAFHFATILHTFSIKRTLYRLQNEILGHLAGTEQAAPDGHPLSVHSRQQLYTIRKELDVVIDLQTTFGDEQFHKTLEKIGREYGALDARLTPDPASADDGAAQDTLMVVRALLLSLSQLDRLHVIAYTAVDRRMEADVRRRNSIVIPVAVMILICGLIGLGYLTRQMRVALAGLEGAERALLDLNDELEQRVEDRTAELKAAQGELVRKERLAAVGQVTATVSHELRNPLGAIRSASDAIRKFAGNGNPQMNRAMALLDRAQVRCDKVITDLLDFTRVRELNLTSTRVDDWLGALLDEHPSPPDITLRRELASGAVTAIDHDRLERALRNVIDNACHAMADEQDEGSKTEADSPTLTVGSRLSGGRLEISVADSGSGIAPDDKARIFEPLFSTKSFGVGLGLPMVKQIAEQHGGGIEIQSEVGRGTEVVLWFPLPAADEGAAA